MSQYSSIDGQDVWNPSHGPGTVFTRLAEAFVPPAGPSGTGVTRSSGRSWRDSWRPRPSWRAGAGSRYRLAELMAGLEGAMPV
ncbi:hypothetical protein SAMN05421837_107707 [Amycolatopsis pretoriensis]|uniref:Uncharacterized protein n=1 Tax=Amycolatopsis pretoriensis TaxID=218821 RepID=A0A1H5R9J0_9PSEU|nr:hypothetical protein [Amycolatopsis pretoriensis]SEF35053.1 hypothetical protein SAMN05421837_107707 [Amycolatopsis pretoriensis]